MKKNKTLPLAVLLFFLLLYAFFFQLIPEEYQAATSYTNAKEFYESTAVNGENCHVDMVNGTIYYATCAKVASSSTNLQYHTLGFDIELSGNGHSVSFTVQRTGGSMEEIDKKTDNTYEYILYSVNDSTLFELAHAANSTESNYVLDASIIRVKMNAILTTKLGNTLNGGITEDDSGGFTKSGTIYRLKDSTDLAALKKTFTGHDFKSYRDISQDMNNYQLNILYSVNGTDSANIGCTSKASVKNGYRLVNYTVNKTVIPYVLYANENIYITSSRVLHAVTLLHPNDIGLKKDGYHLVSGEEWTYGGRYFTHTSYMPKEIAPNTGYSNQNIILYANWQANTYTVNYNANGGSGTVTPSSFTYDTPDKLRTNTYSKTGYYLEKGKEWNTRPDGSGTNYASGQETTNLTANNGATITLYANWKPVVVSITTEKKGGTGGSNRFYETYGIGFYSESSSKTSITSITPPQKTGYTFQGYYECFYPSGQKITDKNGKILISDTYYVKNSTIYASYEPKTYTITFDKQGGIGGSDSVHPIYDEVLPFAEAPIKTGYAFQGYYTKPNGKGTLYYNEFMASDTIYKKDGNITLYAHWTDETPPDVYLTSSCNIWTNQTITVNVRAIDYGSGLTSIRLYADGTLAAEVKNLNGVIQKTLSIQNEKEGVILYKAVVTDVNGNKAETSLPIYYDIKAPTGKVTAYSLEENQASFTVNVTDINVP